VPEHGDENGVQHRRSGVDVVTLVVGIVALLASAYALSDGAEWFPDMNLRWVLAGGAVLAGILMLIASVRGGKRCG
jgi:hypothetical protein